MRTAITQGRCVAVLAVCLSATFCDRVAAQGKPGSGRGPEAGASKAEGPPEATPKRLLPQPRPLEDAPAASEEAPGRWQNCPDPGRKLELIV